MKEIIIAEANFLQELLYFIYRDRKKISNLDHNTIKLRLQKIRDEARKEDDKNDAHS